MSPSARPCTGVLLAAGAGSRLGLGPKALLPLAFPGGRPSEEVVSPGGRPSDEGARGDRGGRAVPGLREAAVGQGLPPSSRPLVVHVAQAMHDGGCHRVVVVLGCGAASVSPLVASYESVVNPDWASGMGSSFRIGVSAALAGANEHDDVMVALVDQPGVNAAMIERLLGAHSVSVRKGKAVTAAGFAPSSAGSLVRGHPIIFSGEAARQAAHTASGDAGARVFLRANPGLIDLVDCSDLGDGRDVDVVADLDLLD